MIEAFYHPNYKYHFAEPIILLKKIKHSYEFTWLKYLKFQKGIPKTYKALKKSWQKDGVYYILSYE